MIPASFQIRDSTIRPAAVLAPMAGVTDTLFRRVIRGLGGCGLLMTEFTSSDGITRSAKKTLRYLYFQEDEHPITAQLFGANPAVMAEAAKMVEDLGYDAVDINLGCPAKKVVRSEEHTSELQSRLHLVCRLLLEKKKQKVYRLGRR